MGWVARKAAQAVVGKIDSSYEEVSSVVGRHADMCNDLWHSSFLSLHYTPKPCSRITFKSLQALRYFLTAEDISPGFFTGNWLYLAKTYYQLGNYAEALKWARKLVAYEAEHLEDVEVRPKNKVTVWAVI